MRSTHSLRHRYHHWEAMTDTSHTLPTITQTHLTTVHYRFVVVGRGSKHQGYKIEIALYILYNYFNDSPSYFESLCFLHFTL